MLESRQSRRRGAFALTVLVGVVAATAATVAIAAGTLGDWPMGGQNINNTRAQDQSTIGVGNVGRLKVKWTATLGGDVSSTPAISGGAVYVTDWGEFEPSKIFSLGGSLTKLDAKTGGVLWTRRIDSYAGEPAGAVSRTSPVVADGVVYVGDQNGGHMLAIDAATGNLIWNTAIANPGPFTIITQSPIIHDGVLYFGAASLEELFVAFGAPCCSFRGSVQALDAKTGAVKWTTYMTPATPAAPDGYSGASVWGSTPALDPKSGTLYVTTGNNYSVPPDVEAGAPDDPANFVDSFVALDIKTGAV
ncbi:MAG: PQQ-binding-like beta-propeller repeat protein, partial [Pseudomonadota bacterium]